MARSPFQATEVLPSRGKEIKLRPLHPNLGIQVEYRARLLRLIEEMNDSTVYWLKSAYRNNPPAMAMDDAPADRYSPKPSLSGPDARLTENGTWRAYVDGIVLRRSDGAVRTWKTREAALDVAKIAMRHSPAVVMSKAVRQMADRWTANIDAAAPKLANYFAKAVSQRTDKSMRSILRQGGFSVKFQMTPAMRDVVEATTAENVGLIRSIASEYFSDIEGLVMRSVSAGRDLGTLAKELEARYPITKRRAALIARDQNNKASANMHRVRQVELGITQAKWRHSGGGKVPRPTHLANNGKLFDVKKGWFDPHEKKWIWPGTLINCRCVSISVIKGFS
jgi:SPP1 gp7 family putative phage head morphogenesis protein